MIEGEYEMAQKKIVIYTETWHPYCWLAQRLLKRKGYQFESVDVTNDSEGRAWLAQTIGQRTVPQVFVRGSSDRRLRRHQGSRPLGRAGSSGARRLASRAPAGSVRFWRTPVETP